ncbi:UDP-3-O-acyl-N-acetylglucosamine deacetylase [Halarsenatibacter silvermanii]|uniref:UDP-3-O-acyl-N-acetylglucosamine deacetylase n=1 Tax=Halarsenatibacter silvermanii TaxID=321763 RepID=A0A1G9HTH0_9FIRM|nr:UDP-3-O-acyl-N-acetylglucosamine deacetylase [Halarsenatibacter silvermanii]SDL16249.1 UDP-3-O-[3-hydroxymyristoyl] N-acetylglucosamine deacetylase [Halarsenatibacter silvermanii]
MAATGNKKVEAELIYPRRQTTITSAVELSGRGLHTGKDCHLRLKPAPADTGVLFRRIDLEGRPVISAAADNVHDCRRSLVLGREDKPLVRTVEHLLSACAGLFLDNLVVEMTGPEIPACDGSAEPLARMMAESGSRKLDAPLEVLQLKEEICFQNGDVSLTALPSEDKEVSFSYQLDYGDRPPGRERCSFNLTGDDYLEELAPARTYVLKCEIAELKKAGLARGGSRDNAVIFGPEGAEGRLRFPDEACRHKLLDLIGDLFLAGPVRAHFSAVKSGHSSNQRLARVLVGIRDSLK